jgi:hypothetical protein
MIKKIIKNIKTTKSNRKWGLFNTKPKFNDSFSFEFCKHTIVEGTSFQNIKFKRESTLAGYCNINYPNYKERDKFKGTIYSYLFKEMNEKAIIHTITHEYLHLAIRTCLGKKPNAKAEEDIIESLIGRLRYNKDKSKVYITKHKEGDKNN